METLVLCLIGVSALLWWGLLLAPWQPWSAAPSLQAGGRAEAEGGLADITVLIPARNEADTIATTLRAISAQDRSIKIILVDDQSSDATAQIAANTKARVRIIAGRALPQGWSGKLWALEQGRQVITTRLTLLLDADIELQPGALAVLRNLMRRDGLSLVSLMATPSQARFWEKLLMPAFIYFFKLLYPFHLSNKPSSRVAAAAGGCILLETQTLAAIGGFAALRDELIDDCSLARHFKKRGYSTWLGLSHLACSQRPFSGLGQIWAMVARTAFTQLRYSLWLLALCTVLMTLLFWVPPAGLFYPGMTGSYLAATALTAMWLSYLPVLRFYGRSPLWALCLPLIGTLYLAMTWTSALSYWRGERARWKDRIYERGAVMPPPAATAAQAIHNEIEHEIYGKGELYESAGDQQNLAQAPRPEQV